jgi:hypothetical protein
MPVSTINIESTLVQGVNDHHTAKAIVGEVAAALTP